MPFCFLAPSSLLCVGISHPSQGEQLSQCSWDHPRKPSVPANQDGWSFCLPDCPRLNPTHTLPHSWNLGMTFRCNTGKNTIENRDFWKQSGPLH